MRILITGGAGFIGSHLAEALLERGDEVVVLDDLSTGSLQNIAHLTAQPGFSYTIGSVTSDKLVADLMDQCDVVFHLAVGGGPLAERKPIQTIETKVHGTETVLRQAAREKKPVVVASTSEVYGKSAGFAFREDADLALGQPTKWVGDVVRALLAVIAEPRSIAQVFNSGKSREVSIRHLTQMIVAKTGSFSAIRFVPSREVFGDSVQDMFRCVPDIGKLRQLAGYAPEVDVDDVLERIIEYWSLSLEPEPIWHDLPAAPVVH